MASKVITFEDGWNRINRQGLSKLVEFLETGAIKHFSKPEISELYTIIYNMCVQRGQNNCAAQLYTNYGSFIRSYLSEKVLGRLLGAQGEEVLTVMITVWENHLIMLRWLKKFFMYLERYHTHQNSLASLKEVGYLAFMTTIFNEVKEQVREALLKQIELHRADELGDMSTMQVEPSVLKKVIQIFVEMKEDKSIYRDELENHLIEASSTHFKNISTQWLSQSFPEYLHHAETVKKFELKRVEEYLDSSTEEALMKAFRKEVLSAKQESLLDKDTGVEYLLRYKKTEDLGRMFRLFSSSEDILKAASDRFRKFVTTEGEQAIQEREQAIKQQTVKESPQDPSFIQGIISLHVEYKKMLKNCFQNNSTFERALKGAFEKFFNTKIGNFTTAELLSTFSDSILKKNTEKLSDDEIEDRLEKIVDLFSHLNDKDLFSESYRTRLANRLLYERSASEDAEKNMITKLKTKCGAHFTKKLEGMVSDLNIAIDGRREFQLWMNEQKNDNLTVDFTPTVLSSAYWPTASSFAVSLPVEMEKCINNFTNYYEKHHHHKVLKWAYSYGTVTLAGYFDKRYDFVVTTYQACVLMMFTKPNASISYQDIKEHTKFDDDWCKRVLASLCLSKISLLKKNSDDRKITSEDRYTVNDDFKSNKRKVALKPPSTAEVKHKERVEVDRTATIEASIVRIMKARKTLGHQELVTEVLRQLSTFRPEPRNIKKTIEKLIEREYLERDESDMTTYNYLAQEGEMLGL